MFAPPVIKAQTKAAASPSSKLASQRSTPAVRPFGGHAVERTHMRAAAVGPSWDLTKVPLFPPERPSHSPGSFPQPRIIHPNPVVGQAVTGARDMEMEGASIGDGTALTDQDAGDGVAPPAVVPQQVMPPMAPPPLSMGPTATVPAHIRGTSSPAGMPDRIPPRVDTPVDVTISGLAIPMRDVTLSIDGAGGGNGTATINGAATADLGASATVNLRGVDQTTPGKAGNLVLVASHGATRLAASAGFSVSAIPQDWSVTLNSAVTGPERGIDVNNDWQSDSGQVADLDKAMRSEQVQYGVGTGCFAGVTGQNSGYRAANSPPLVDHHAAPIGLLTGVGAINAEQTFIFKDDRTGAVNIPARNSGYRLSRVVTAPTPGTLSITTTKTGTATTANGFASAAGAGGATSGPQVV